MTYADNCSKTLVGFGLLIYVENAAQMFRNVYRGLENSYLVLQYAFIDRARQADAVFAYLLQY